MRNLATLVTGLTLAFCVFGCGQDKASVECKGAGAKLGAGFSCAVAHTEGRANIHVCWDLNIACQNGANGKAHACGDVEPQAKSSTNVPFSAFNGALDKCDAVKTASVTGMALTRK
jgi:hypothetical protein